MSVRAGPPKTSRLDEPTAARRKSPAWTSPPRRTGDAAFREGLERGLEEARTAAGSPPQGPNGLAPALRARPRLTVTCSAPGFLQARSRSKLPHQRERSRPSLPHQRSLSSCPDPPHPVLAPVPVPPHQSALQAQSARSRPGLLCFLGSFGSARMRACASGAERAGGGRSAASTGEAWRWRPRRP